MQPTNTARSMVRLGTPVLSSVSATNCFSCWGFLVGQVDPVIRTPQFSFRFARCFACCVAISSDRIRFSSISISWRPISSRRRRKAVAVQVDPQKGDTREAGLARDTMTSCLCDDSYLICVNEKTEVRFNNVVRLSVIMCKSGRFNNGCHVR